MKSFNKWKSDLTFGEKYEAELIKLLKPTKYKTHPNCPFKSYDLKIYNEENKKVYLEVKADRMTHRTNNICIEYSHKDEPSGIYATKADFYAYFVIKGDNEYDLYLIPTKYILELIREKKYHKNINGGDGFRCRMFLFNNQLFSKFCFQYDDLACLDNSKILFTENN